MRDGSRKTKVLRKRGIFEYYKHLNDGSLNIEKQH